MVFLLCPLRAEAPWAGTKVLKYNLLGGLIMVVYSMNRRV